jgi:hypothetical protein
MQINKYTVEYIITYSKTSYFSTIRYWVLQLMFFTYYYFRPIALDKLYFVCYTPKIKAIQKRIVNLFYEF